MRRPAIFYGWWIVAAGMGVTSLTSTLFVYGFSAFFIPWRENFGWSRAVLGGVVGLSRLEGGLVAPVAGWFIDKYGPRPMMFLGLAMMGLGYFALSRINSLVMLYIVFLGLLATGSSFGTYRPVQVAVANWFVRRRGRAIGLVMAGSGLGGGMVFVFGMAIEFLGWRGGAILAGLVIWGGGWLFTCMIRHKPEQSGLLPDGDRVPISMEGQPGPTSETHIAQGMRAINRGDVISAFPETQRRRRFWMSDPRPEVDFTFRQALRTQAFWLMAVTWAIWSTMPGITTVHIAPFLAEELDLDYVVALAALSFFAGISVVGRVGIGFLADFVNVRLLMTALLVMQGVGIFLFSQIQSLAQVPLYVSIFAIPYGGTVVMRSVLQGYFFGRKEFGTIGGLLSLVDLPATVAAPIWVGWLADAVPGGYRIGFRIIALILVVGAGCILLARRPRV